MNYLTNKELTITSVELVEIINEFRKVESEVSGKEYKELLHKNFMAKIEKEAGTLKTLGLEAGLNFQPSEYRDCTGRKLPCYKLNRDGMLQMLNSESTLVRYKTIEYINSLEEEVNKPVTIDKYEIATRKAKCDAELMDLAANMLGMNDNSKLKLLHDIYNDNNVTTKYLPAYTKSEGTLKAATALLKENNINMSAQKFNKLMLEKGLLEKKERRTSKNLKKTFNSLTDLYFGENQVSPASPRETQPLYYENKFKELLEKLGVI